MNATKPYHFITLLDNASVHLDVSDFPVIWQSPYSPDFNPIEKVFGLIKSRMKGYEYTVISLEKIIKEVIKSITKEDVYPFFIHCQKLWRDDNYV